MGMCELYFDKTVGRERECRKRSKVCLRRLRNGDLCGLQNQSSDVKLSVRVKSQASRI